MPSLPLRLMLRAFQPPIDAAGSRVSIIPIDAAGSRVANGSDRGSVAPRRNKVQSPGVHIIFGSSEFFVEEYE